MTTALKQAIRRDGRSLNEIAVAAQIDRGILSRLMRDERSVTLTTADAVCAVLGVDCRLVKQAKGGEK